MKEMMMKALLSIFIVASAFGCVSFAGPVAPRRMTAVGDAGAVYDATVRALAKRGMNVEAKDRDAGTVQTAWLITLPGGRPDIYRRMKLTIVGEKGGATMIPFVEYCPGRRASCFAMDQLTTEEDKFLERLSADIAAEIQTSAPSSETSQGVAGAETPQRPG